MRVAYIGNFAVSYSTESHVALSLRSLGVDVVEFQEQNVQWQKMPKLVKEAGADFVLWTHTHGFAPESTHELQDDMLDGLADIGIPIVAYHLDRWWGLEREYQTAEPYFQCDLVCTADGGHDDEWESIGVNHVWFPPAVVHTEIGRGTPSSRNRGKDVGFVGSWMNYGHRDVWPWRYELVAHLRRRYGQRFRSWPRGNQPVRGHMLNDVYAALTVTVGDSCLAGSVKNYWSDRIPETLGRGGFLLHPWVDGLRDEYPIALPWTFDVGDIAGLDHRIGQALDLPAHARDLLIEEAIEYVRDHHTYRHRMERLLELVGTL